MEKKIKHFLKDHAYQNIPLTYEEAYALGQYTLVGCGGDNLAQIQSNAVLCSLHNRATYAWQWDERTERCHGHRLPQTAAEQIAGVCAAIFEHDIATSEFGFLDPQVPCLMDNCGMGGDLVVTANISTIAALIASAAGIPMCKHGSPANADQGKHGSSDFISLLGIDSGYDLERHICTATGKSEIERCLESEGFAYTEALDVRYKRVHRQTHDVARLPHMNDIIGPITNPLNPKRMTRRILGINHLISPRVVAKAYQILNGRGITYLKHGLFIRGFVDETHYEGMDEVSICRGGTQVAELQDGVITEYDLHAEDFGLAPVDRSSISPNGMSKGIFSLGILKGEISGPPLEMVLANAALLFWLADRSSDLKECYVMAQEIHASGKAYEKMLAVRRQLPKREREAVSA